MAPQQPAERAPIDFVIRGSIGPADEPALCERLRQLIAASERPLVACDVRLLDDPDLGSVQVIARLALTARRLGGRFGLRHASPELRELLQLCGLLDAVPCSEGSGLEARRQPKEWEEAIGIQEEGDPRDPVS